MVNIGAGRAPSATWIEGDVQRLPSNWTERYDVVLGNYVMPFVRKPETFFIEANRVLRIGGRFAFTRFVLEEGSPLEVVSRCLSEGGKQTGVDQRIDRFEVGHDDYVSYTEPVDFCSHAELRMPSTSTLRHTGEVTRDGWGLFFNETLEQTLEGIGFDNVKRETFECELGVDTDEFRDLVRSGLSRTSYLLERQTAEDREAILEAVMKELRTPLRQKCEFIAVDKLKEPPPLPSPWADESDDEGEESAESSSRKD
jgi:hypothetical protein